MDIDNLQQNLNTRVVFKEPRGMVRWLQLFFAIIAFATVVDFTTNVGITITCPAAVVNNTTTPPVTQSMKLVASYPFDFSSLSVNNTCPGFNATYNHLSSLTASPQFFVMTGVLALVYSSASIVVYLFYSSTYSSLPVFPVADLIISAILALFWLIGSSSLGSGVTLLKSTFSYQAVQQTLCPGHFTQSGGICTPTDQPSWKALNVALVSGFTSFFLWTAGLWFVFKETHFHTARNQF